MKSTLALALAPFLTTALAQSTPSPPPGPNYFGVIAARSASPIHLSTLTARGLKFYLGGGPPATYCAVTACPPGNTTVLAGGDNTLSMAVDVPGGQQVYIAPDGALSYTQAHSAYIPPGSVVDGFSREYPAAGQQFGYLNFETGFVACPTANQTANGWQVFGQVDGATFGPECLGFDALTIATDTISAWQYA
ncbi:hypothetical protein EK21DRAFT_113618 [Setomelanomma holmii]|uniref:IgE-binding protein n=1 Tax=Setomelanomma holmii TaxID=210430 RepID=A0A9P4H8B3_9PLEO|nr:hypothetical protein EK21DRAFT_113618 [Setomelanomma holmii]